MPASKAAPAQAEAAPAATNYPVIQDKPAIAEAEDYFRDQAEIGRLEQKQKERKARLVAAMNGAPVAYAGRRILRVTPVAGTPATDNLVITKEMVGQVIPGRKGKAGSTRFEVT